MSTANTRNFYNKDILETDSLFWSPNYLEPSAWIEHIPFSFWLIENFRPGNIVELGVYNGCSYFSFCQAIDRLNLNSKTYGIDSWKGDEHAGFYEEDVFKRVVTYNENNYSKFSTLIRSTFDEARQYFTNGSIDLLHIDGLHTYEAIKHDFETWFPCLSENAIILLHDINVRERNFGVFRYWEELKGNYSHFEFDFGSGLGIIATGKEYSPVLQSLFKKNKSSEYYNSLRNLFSDRGSFFKKKLDFLFLKNQADELQHAVNIIQKEKADLNEQLMSKTDQLEKIKEQLHTTTNEFEILRELQLKENEELNHIKQLNSHDKEIIDELRKKETDVLEESNKYQIKNVELQRLLNERELSFEKTKDELNQLQASYTILKSNLESATEQLKEFEYQTKKLSRESVIYKDQQDKLQEYIEQLENGKKQLHQNLQTAQKQNMQLKTYSKQLEKQSDMIQQQNLDLQNRLQISNTTVEGLNKTILLSAKSLNGKRMSSRMEKLRPVYSLIFKRYPGLARFLKRSLALVKWTVQGTKKQNIYKLKFWKKNPHVPYQLIDNYLKIENSNLFDKDWYLLTYKDVQEDHADPILHYILHGFYEGRDPGPLFSTLKYLDHYKDVRQAKENALLHYLYHGKNEGREIFSVNKKDSSIEFPYPITHDLIVPSIEDDVLSYTEIKNYQHSFEKDNITDFLTRSPQKKGKFKITEIKKVAFIAQPEYFDFHYREVLEDLYTVDYFPNSFSEDPVFFQKLIDFNADINIFFRGELVPVDVLNMLNGINVNLSSEPFPKIINRSLIYTEDSLNRFKFFLRIFERPFDYIFHYDEISKTFFEKQGIELSGYFPFPVATEVIKPARLQKKWDIFFSGRSTPHRDDYFGPLKRDFNFLHINHGVVGPDLLEFIHKCKIAVNIHAENEISWEPRTQFLMAAGALLVSEPLSQTCPLQPGVDYIEVKDQFEMYNICQKILHNYDDFTCIAENGRKRIETELSSRNNFPVFFDNILNERYQRAAFNDKRLNLEPLVINLKYNGFEHLLTELLHEHS